MRPVLRLRLVTLAMCVLALLHAGAAFAEGNTLYVQTSGNDTAPCTETAPCKTITHAVQLAVSGDTIKVGVGTFPEGTGVSLGWIDPSQTFAPVFWINPGVTVTLKNKTITGGTLGGVQNWGNLTTENLVIWKNTGDGGIRNTNT